MSTLLRFKHLKQRGIVASFAQVKHLQEKEGFPLGRLLGPNTRVWTEDEVEAWLASRPTERKAVKVNTGEAWHAARKKKRRAKHKQQPKIAAQESATA
jgi:hypothetical protein